MEIAWGILGAGKIAARQFAPAVALAQGQRLVAVMRRNLDEARAFAAAHGAPRAYDSAAALLADAEVNAVYVATPPHLHAGQTILAAERGKHILCEKPMALDVAEAQRMVDACAANGVQLMVCYYQRYNARHQRIKEWLDAGAIGRVTAARLSFSDYFPPQPGFWHHDPRISGGGPLMDLAPHCVDLLRWLCCEVVEVRAMVDTLVSDSPVEDTATLLLRLANGAHAVITTHWSTYNGDPNQFNRLEVYGTHGTIVATPIHAKDSAGLLQCITPQGTEDASVAAGGPRPHVRLLEAFADALRRGQPVPVSGADGLASLAVIRAAYRAAQTGTPVQLR